jgi:molecular chaperone GrpE
MESQDDMTKNDKPLDQAVEDELKGVPEHLRDNAEEADQPDDMAEALAALRRDLDGARQEVLYAQAETQNVRRRLEREKDEARAYAATGFARDILSVADNLARAVAAIPDSLRADESMKGLVVGLEATQRELEKVFAGHGITRIAAVGLPLDPNQHQAMLEVPTSDHEPGTVVSEMQAGWMIKDRLLRAAMVAVAKAPE